MHNLSRTQKLELLEEKKRRSNVYRYKIYYQSRCPWQKKFIANTAEFSQVALIAANRVGKTDNLTRLFRQTSSILTFSSYSHSTVKNTFASVRTMPPCQALHPATRGSGSRFASMLHAQDSVGENL